MVKSPPSHNNTPSPSSTISDINSPPLAISTRRPRTSRKRPNQTYDEAAALLSTAYPNIFSSKKKKSQILGIIKSPFTEYDEASQLLLPLESIEEKDSLFNPWKQKISNHLLEHKEVHFDDSEVDQIGIFQEIEEGIDSFMGNIESIDGESEAVFSGSNCHNICRLGEVMMNPLYGSSIGLGLRRDEDWWKYSTVEFERISPRIQTVDDGHCQSKAVDGGKSKTIEKKKKKKVAPVAVESMSSEDPHLNPKPEQRVSPLLKLDYDGVLDAWSDKESPFPDEIMGLEAAGIDFYKLRLGEIDLFGESGMREAIVLRYKEKRRNRLFSKNIRYQVRKHTA